MVKGVFVLQFTDFTKMVAVDRECYRQGQKFGAAKKGPHHQVPVLDTLFTEYPDSDSSSKERQEALEVDRYRDFWRLVFL